MNPTGSVQLPSEITEASRKARELTAGATAAEAATGSVTDALRQKIQEAYSSNQDITSALDTSTAKYYQAPTEARSTYQGIFNPFDREKLIAQYVQGALLPVLSNSSLYGQRIGRTADLLNAGTNAYTAQVGKQFGDAQLAQGLASDLLQQYQVEQQIRAQLESERLAREQFAFEKSKPRAGSGTPDLSGLLSVLLGIGAQGTGDWEDITGADDNFLYGNDYGLEDNFRFGPSQADIDNR